MSLRYFEVRAQTLVVFLSAHDFHPATFSPSKGRSFLLRLLYYLIYTTNYFLIPHIHPHFISRCSIYSSGLSTPLIGEKTCPGYSWFQLTFQNPSHKPFLFHHTFILFMTNITSHVSHGRILRRDVLLLSSPFLLSKQSLPCARLERVGFGPGV